MPLGREALNESIPKKTMMCGAGQGVRIKRLECLRIVEDIHPFHPRLFVRGWINLVDEFLGLSSVRVMIHHCSLTNELHPRRPESRNQAHAVELRNSGAVIEYDPLTFRRRGKSKNPEGI